ncbi:MAG: S8 family serine peptidase, partial [Elusimicrobia bacterium]|nr:S8 family serine peptidase [Elusimicrobiota bacterium]
YSQSSSFHDELKTAYNENIVLVAAAGNDFTYTECYPAAYPEVIGVAATDHDDNRSHWGSYGSNVGPWIDIAAPGTNILSTVPSRVASSGYISWNGTSMACPHVAGAAAMIRSVKPAFTNEEIRSTIKINSDPINPDFYIGQGRLNLQKTLTFENPNLFAYFSLEEEIGGIIQIHGDAYGEYFDHYTLYYGKSNTPEEWIELYSSDQPVANGVLLADFKTFLLDNDFYTFRLVVTDRFNNTIESIDWLTVFNLMITDPLNNDMIKPGNILEITGKTYGYQYKLEHGAGFDPQNWSDQGITLTPGVSGMLGRWDTSSIHNSEFYNLRLTLFTEIGERYFYSEMFYFEPRLREGFPVYINIQRPEGSTKQRFIVADLDQTGNKEIITSKVDLISDFENELIVFDADGHVRWSHVFEDLNGNWSPFATGNIDEDPMLEIVIAEFEGNTYGKYRIWAFNHDGSICTGWPIEVDSYMEGNCIADLNNDGYDEIILASDKWLYFINGEGTILKTIRLEPETSQYADPNPVVGNFDEDPDLEVATFYGANGIVIYNFDGTLVPGWPKIIDPRDHAEIIEAIVAGDVDKDSYDEIIFVTDINYYDPKLFIVKKDGSIYKEIDLPESHYTAPSLADVNNDGFLEICVGQMRSVILFDYKGAVIPPFPVSLPDYPPKTPPWCISQLRSQCSIADINHDGNLDIVFVAGGIQEDSLTKGIHQPNGGIFALNINGTYIDLNPDPNSVCLYKERNMSGTCTPPCFDDIDYDGKIDLICSNIVEFGYGSQQSPVWYRKNRNSISVYELNDTYDKNSAAWPMFLHNINQTGRYTDPRILPAPANFTGTAAAADKINYTWDDLDNENGYRIYKTPKTNVSGDLPANQTSWTYEALEPNTVYECYIKGFNDFGESHPSSVAQVATLALLPSDLSVDTVTNNSVSLSWDGRGGSSYE